MRDVNRVRRPRARTVVVASLLVAVVTVLVTANVWVLVAARGKVVDPAGVAPGSTALVLGSLVSDGEPGDYVRGRLDTALALYRSGRVVRIINSGNGSADAGNEPAVMRSYLEARGVPAAAIVDDPAGFDTEQSCDRIDEVVRANDGSTPPIVIVTQDFHLSRAIALCRHHGVDAVGVVAECDCSWWTLARNQVRESLFARPRALWSVLT